jgi:hypothetical protein
MEPHGRVFRIKVFNGLKICPSLLETVGLLVPTRRLRDFTFNIDSNHRNSPSARSASADNSTSVKILYVQEKMYFCLMSY